MNFSLLHKILVAIEEFPRGVVIGRLKLRLYERYACEVPSNKLHAALKYLAAEGAVEQGGVGGGSPLWGPVGLIKIRKKEAEELEKNLLALLLANATIGIRRKDICTALNIPYEDRHIIREALDALEKQGKISRFPTVGIQCRWGGPNFRSERERTAPKPKKEKSVCTAPKVVINKANPINSVWELGK